MILCDSEIRAALHYGTLLITPAPMNEDIATTAIDLRLGGELKRWKKPVAGATTIVDPTAPGFSYPEVGQAHLEVCKVDEHGGYVLDPHEFILGITEERVELPHASRIAARVEGKSTLARLGLGVHITAPTIHAGWRGQITLEITNQGTLPIRLKPGMKICQLIVEQVYGTPQAELRTAFQDQTTVIGPKRV
jgi:dCTP deaminase